jgi:hypothetical protein
MTRKRIQLVKGAIAPVSRTLWSAASEKLQEAENGITQMRNAQDRISYEAGWTKLIDALVVFWSRFFDEGEETSTDFKQWTDELNPSRKKDELLRYLIQARHQNQHGRIALQWGEPSLLIAPNFNGHIRGFELVKDGTYEMDSTPLHASLPEASIAYNPGDALLPVVNNKLHKQIFNPPTHHNDKPIHNMSPVEVAQIGLDYYRNILALAHVMFG